MLYCDCMMNSSHKRILVVDDEEDIAFVTSALLNRSGYETAYTINGDEVPELIKSFRPDLIILDINMPNINGSYIAARLAENSETKHIPVILLSALVSRTEELLGNVSDKHRYLMSKPANHGDLIRQIESMLAS
jgi:CheY-like chemotaxis protein